MERHNSTAEPPLNGVLHEPGPADKTRRKKRSGIVALHGSEGSALSGINTWLAPFLALKGYLVLSANTRSSGSSYYLSIFDWCEDDLRHAVDFLEKDRAATNVVLIGHSLGAAEAVFYQGKTHDPRVKGLVLLGAPLWPRDVLDPGKLRLASKHLEDEGYLMEAEDGMPVSVEHYMSYWGPESNNDIRKWIGSVDVPILNIAHGLRINELCNEEASRKISTLAANSPKVTTIAISEVGHSFAGHFEEAESAVLDWLEQLDKA